MNDNDLERDLRSQRGPREEGYAPAGLPMTLEEAPVRASGYSRLPRVAMFAGVAVAGALAVALVAGIFSGSGPDVGSGSESPSASTPPMGVCQPADVVFNAEPWGGGMGSRGTVVTVTLADGRYACTLGGGVAASIKDANGDVIVSAQTAAAGSVDLEPDAAFTVGVAWSNWCGAAPAAPVSLSLKFEGWASAVPVDVPGGLDPVPPCNGAGEPSALSVTNLQPAQ
jgi:hypothetical protein